MKCPSREELTKARFDFEKSLRVCENKLRKLISFSEDMWELLEEYRKKEEIK